jgi:hypothetical protein
MKDLIAIPVFAFALMLQTAVISRITLLTGAADLVLLVLVAWALQEQVESAWHWAVLAGLMVAFFSGLPPVVPVLGYLLAVALARFVIHQVWQTYTVLFFNGTPLPFGDVLALITLPSVFLNFLLSIPVHSLIRDLALWVYPLEEML